MCVCVVVKGSALRRFGHSSTQAWLLSAEAGFDALYFGRIDFEDHDLRFNESRLELIWRASQSLGAPAQVFTGAFMSGNYGPPSGLCFDIYCRDGQIQDDLRMTDYNVDYYVDLAVNRSLEQANNTAPTGHIMWKMGSDFQYRNAREWFKNLDKLMHYVNEKSDETGIHMFYSSPTAYTEAVNAAGLTWTVKTDDFFPYRDNPHAAWTGYFTSRPALKGYVRYAGNVMRAAGLADALNGGDSSSIELLWEAVGVTEHHDAVSGTSKQHVAYDYAKRISIGVEQGFAVVAKAISGGPGPSTMTYCPRLNESVCEPTQSAGASGFDVVPFNWLARPRDLSLRIPIPDGWAAAVVTVANGSIVPSTTLPNLALPSSTDNAQRSVHFIAAGVPAGGWAAFTVKPAAVAQETDRQVNAVPPSITNGLIEVRFDTTTGGISGIANIVSGANTTLTQEWLWYNSSSGGDNWGNGGNGPNSYGQPSGAYIFRPNTSTAFPAAEATAGELVAPHATANSASSKLQAGGRMDGSRVRSTSVSYGATAVEVNQVFTDWLSQTVRLVNGQDYAEVEATIGPVPIDGNLGREVITRFSTDIASGADYYTDSNGREFLKRVRDFRPTYNLTLFGETVTNNYYPVDAAIRIEDSTRVFSVLTDRSQAGGSLASGQLELMAHRRVLQDDRRGVGEPLNETVSARYFPTFERIGHGLIVRVNYKLRIDTPAAAASGYRPLMENVFAAPLAFFNTAGDSRASGSLFNGLNWPVNAHLANLDARGNGSLVVRVTHPFQAGEGPLAAPVTVDLADLFPGKTITKAVETTLTANQPLSELHRLVWKTTDNVAMDSGLGREPIEVFDPKGVTALPVELQPQQFRTFMVDISA